MENVVIVGASLAGGQAAQTLRRSGFDGQLTLIGDEAHRPYDRPPLSKGYLAGTFDEDRLWLRSVADPDALGLTLRLGVGAVGLALNPEQPGGEVELADGSAVAFDGLIIATGARAREIPGQPRLDGVHLVRTLDDAQDLRRAFEGDPQRVVVIGCGFVGTEVAATAREKGLEVTLIDSASAPLSRVLDADAGMAVADLHRGHGVDVRLNVGVSRLVSDDAGRVQAVELNDDAGTVIPADVVVVGIGVVPNTEWLEGSGLQVDDGVVVDEYCVAAPGVVAAGDVARWPQQRFGGRLARVEQWDNAVEMGGHAAKNLLALSQGETATTFDPVPWFWSDQYDRKIQLAGIPSGNVALLWGAIEDQQFVQAYLDDDGTAVGVLTWNRPRQAMLGRQMVASGASLEELQEKLG